MHPRLQSQAHSSYLRSQRRGCHRFRCTLSFALASSRAPGWTVTLTCKQSKKWNSQGKASKTCSRWQCQRVHRGTSLWLRPLLTPQGEIECNFRLERYLTQMPWLLHQYHRQLWLWISSNMLWWASQLIWISSQAAISSYNSNKKTSMQAHCIDREARTATQ